MAWDDSLCASCGRKAGKGGWDEIKKRKDKVIDDVRTVEKVRFELVRIF